MVLVVLVYLRSSVHFSPEVDDGVYVSVYLKLMRVSTSVCTKFFSFSVRAAPSLSVLAISCCREDLHARVKIEINRGDLGRES